MAGKFKKGDKLKIPTRKTAATRYPLEDCSLIQAVRETRQDYCFVVSVPLDGEQYVLGSELDHEHSTFHESDLESYNSVNNTYSIF